MKIHLSKFIFSLLSIIILNGCSTINPQSIDRCFRLDDKRKCIIDYFTTNGPLNNADPETILKDLKISSKNKIILCNELMNNNQDAYYNDILLKIGIYNHANCMCKYVENKIRHNVNDQNMNLYRDYYRSENCEQKMKEK